MILDDFDVEIEEANMKSFCENCNLKSQQLAIKILTNLCIDSILTNARRMFQSTYILETGLSDFYLMTLTVMRKTFKKMHPRVINYRSYRDFSNETFRASLINNLSNVVFADKDDELQKFCQMTMDTLNSFAPTKKKYVPGN